MNPNSQANPSQQPNQQKGQPDPNKQGYGQPQNKQPGANQQQQGKPGYDPSKTSARPQDEEDEEEGKNAGSKKPVGY